MAKASKEAGIGREVAHGPDMVWDYPGKKRWACSCEGQEKQRSIFISEGAAFRAPPGWG